MAVGPLAFRADKFGKMLGVLEIIYSADYLGPFLAVWNLILVIWISIWTVLVLNSSKISLALYPLIHEQ